MHLIIAADSFKDALSADLVCTSIAQGLQQALPDAQITSLPLGDGGEGTATLLTRYANGHLVSLQVEDPLGRKVTAMYGLHAIRQTAFMDMATASGLELLQTHERNPMKTSTFGTGQLIRHAIQKGVTEIVLGIGGSATNDGGMGMATALGYRFLDKNGQELPPLGESLVLVRQIDTTQVIKELQDVKVKILCDVDNPLYGPRGAAHVYAAQKGADEAMILALDAGLEQLASVIRNDLGKEVAKTPGSGAAGGLGAGGIAFLNAELTSGIDYMLEQAQLEQHLRQADLLFTGEGSIDAQSSQGKLISGLCRLAQQEGVPVIALCGRLSANVTQIEAMGLRAAFSIQQEATDLAKAIQQTAMNLEKTAFHIGRLISM